MGKTPLGGDNPIRLQSMTNVSTLDTDACVAQSLRIVRAGGEYVRLTTQGVREAENLSAIRKGLADRACQVPLVADVHFNAHVADVAALHADKVRINPGNYVDPGRKFIKKEYTEDSYQQELDKLEQRFSSFLALCKSLHRAIRIGVNHGSLSDRIMSRYGDTPEGMVESCMEFLRVCRKEAFQDVVISIKASNTVVMVQTVRLLVRTMEEEGMSFPLHLGVTEAGDGEDGRIKSALGIGALLADGYGDTIRVSLSEAPEAEIPVARQLRDYITERTGHPLIPGTVSPGFDYVHPVRRKTRAVGDIGGTHVPVVIADRMSGTAEGTDGENMPDYIYVGRECPSSATQRCIIDADLWRDEPHLFPAFVLPLKPEDNRPAPQTPEEMEAMRVHDRIELTEAYMTLNAQLRSCTASVKFLFLSYPQLSDEMKAILRLHPEVVVIAQSGHINRPGELRALAHELMNARLDNPVVFYLHERMDDTQREAFMIHSAADMGPLVFDGLCDGIYLHNEGSLSPSFIDATAFGILQAGRLRTTKTEYISCPGCGRTLYDLQHTIAEVKAATRHLKGKKIAIMGCIVNGPGEMADADYGYVGAGVGRISLYRGKECVEKNIPSSEAVAHLLSLIESDMLA